MKKLAIILAVVLMVGCSGKTGTQQDMDMQQHAKNMVALVKHGLDRNHIDTTKVECVYNEEKKRVEVSWKGKLMNIGYNVYSKDIFGDNSNSLADGFGISIVLFNSGVKSISCMEIKTYDRKYIMSPMVVKPVGDDCLVIGFGISEESFVEGMKLLTESNRAIIDAKLHSNKGSVKIPIGDAIKLKDMARSYIIDGGKFE